MAPEQSPGTTIYTPRFLGIYDIFVLWFSNNWLWRCSTRDDLLPLFRSALGRRHLDIGVGTGYFPASALPGSVCEEVTLADLNPMPLRAAEMRVRSAAGDGVKVHTLLADAAAPLPLPAEQRFDSISLFYLLHCMPGPAARKTGVFEVLRARLAPGGVLVGATILGRGADSGWLAALVMPAYNRSGIFCNKDDGREVFEVALRKGFEQVEVQIVGSVMLFTARGVKGV